MINDQPDDGTAPSVDILGRVRDWKGDAATLSTTIALLADLLARPGNSNQIIITAAQLDEWKEGHVRPEDERAVERELNSALDLPENTDVEAVDWRERALRAEREARRLQRELTAFVRELGGSVTPGAEAPIAAARQSLTQLKLNHEDARSRLARVTEICTANETRES